MNLAAVTSYAEQARARKMTDATAVGIDDALISRLVEKFYERVQDDKLLGPIFTAHVADWAPHLAQMKDFWASVTLESGRFNGSPMAKHVAIGGLEQIHFARWLTLWHKTVGEIAPNDAAAEVFRSAAQRIASSLLTGIQVHRGGLAAISPRAAAAS
jgi:hemoglobin